MNPLGIYAGAGSASSVQALGQTLIVSAAEPPAASVVRGTLVRLGWSREDAQILNETGEATG